MFLTPTLLQPHFSVTTVFTQFSFYFWSRPRKYVATEWLLFSPLLLSQLLKLNCNMLLIVQPIFMPRHEISDATSTSVFSLYLVATANSLVDTFPVHQATIPRRDINYLLRPEFFSFGVATYRTVSRQDLSLKPLFLSQPLFSYRNNFHLA